MKIVITTTVTLSRPRRSNKLTDDSALDVSSVLHEGGVDSGVHVADDVGEETVVQGLGEGIPAHNSLTYAMWFPHDL